MSSSLKPRSAAALSPLVFLTLIVIALMMGANHVAARFAFNSGVSVATAVAARGLVTALIVALILWKVNANVRFDAQQKRGLLLVGLLIAIQSQLLYASVARLPVAIALLVFNSYPLWAAFWEWCFYKQRPPKHLLIVMPIIFVGLALALNVQALVIDGASSQALNPLGVGLGLAAGMTFGLALVLTAKQTVGVDGRVRTVSSQLMAGLMALCVLMTQGGAQLPTGEHVVSGWLGLCLLVLLYGTAFTMLFTVLPKLGVMGNSAVMNTEPVFALLLAWVFLGQVLAPMQVLGGLIVVTAVVWLGTRK